MRSIKFKNHVTAFILFLGLSSIKAFSFGLEGECGKLGSMSPIAKFYDNFNAHFNPSLKKLSDKVDELKQVVCKYYGLPNEKMPGDVFYSSGKIALDLYMFSNETPWYKIYYSNGTEFFSRGVSRWPNGTSAIRSDDFPNGQTALDWNSKHYYPDGTDACDSRYTRYYPGGAVAGDFINRLNGLVGYESNTEFYYPNGRLAYKNKVWLDPIGNKTGLTDAVSPLEAFARILNLDMRKYSGLHHSYRYQIFFFDVFLKFQ